MNHRDKLDDIYSDLISNKLDCDDRQTALDLIDELQNLIEDLN